GLPLAVVVWNNNGYGEIRRYMDFHEVTRLGVDLPAPDFMALAAAFGCHGVHAACPQALTEALTASQAARVPTLIEVNADHWPVAT
ncbi:MAG TPA: thiamine pyrophosphate-dependent enzyme, partial [Modicisalibacter sp.]|nr:thiamine pyrophosphate-dependent enzyme [Modicisalibacter sp.]